MLNSRWTTRREFPRVILAASLLGCLLATTQAAWATDPIIRVEEDWEMVVETPDYNSNGPQIRTVFSPTGDVNSLHAAFTLNHRSQSDYVAGGMQLQVWYGEDVASWQKFPRDEKLATAGEAVNWTQEMRMDGSTITFEIANGNSTTWGSFGSQGYLKHSVNTEFSNLNNYSPTVSASNSEIGFAANHVRKLYLKEVRYYTSAGLVQTDTTDIVVHELESGDD